MVIIKKVLYVGGACPYQIEAITDDGKFFYLRYRGGTLRYGVWESEDAYDCTNYTFTKTIGDEYDGWGDHESISKALEGQVVFPKGFTHQSFKDENNSSVGRVFDGKPLTESDVQDMIKKLFDSSSEDSFGPRNPIIPN